MRLSKINVERYLLLLYRDARRASQLGDSAEPMQRLLLRQSLPFYGGRRYAGITETLLNRQTLGIWRYANGIDSTMGGEISDKIDRE